MELIDFDLVVRLGSKIDDLAFLVIKDKNGSRVINSSDFLQFFPLKLENLNLSSSQLNQNKIILYPIILTS